jgi:hypothetical protein
VNRKLTVVRNVITAPRLPKKDALGEIGLNAISRATDSSTVPIKLETARTLRNEYIHDMNGLFMMSGRIASASANVNFCMPIQKENQHE